MNRLTQKSVMMRMRIVTDVARAYLTHPEPLTKQELQALCSNVTLTPSWLHKLQQAKVLKCEGTRHAKYTLLQTPYHILSNITQYANQMNEKQVFTTVTRRKATYEELLAVVKHQRQEINLLKSKRL
jgi:hypothetical protein